MLVCHAARSSSARAGFAISTKDQVHIRAGAVATVILWVVIGVQAGCAIGSGIQFRTLQAPNAVAVGVEFAVWTDTLLGMPIKHKAGIAGTFRNGTLVGHGWRERDAMLVFLWLFRLSIRVLVVT
jgi:hypothetical protein